MIPYWVLFIIPAFIAANARPEAVHSIESRPRVRIGPIWFFVGLALTIFMGFRYEVGGDWYNYMRHFDVMQFQDWNYAVAQSEPAHWLMNKAMAELGLGMTGVNVAYAAIFSAGFIVFARSLPRPWLALAAAVPYLITVVGMGYSRQAVALGFALIGLAELRRGGFVTFTLWVLVGATFHNSAVMLIPLAGLTSKRNRIRTIAGVSLMSFVGIEFFLSNRLDRLIDVYIDRRLTDSEGALIRLSMNALAAAAFLVYRKGFMMSDLDRRLWSIFSLIALAMLLAYFATELSTALDRMALYIIPLQIVTFAHLPDALGRPAGRNTGPVLIILGYYTLVYFVWLNFAGHAPYWLPYQMGIVD